MVKPSVSSVSPVQSVSAPIIVAHAVEPDVSKSQWLDVRKGTVVIHKSFGEGTVMRVDKVTNYIHINFASGKKTFLFPDTFEKCSINSVLGVKSKIKEP